MILFMGNTNCPRRIIKKVNNGERRSRRHSCTKSRIFSATIFQTRALMRSRQFFRLNGIADSDFYHYYVSHKKNVEPPLQKKNVEKERQEMN